MPKFVVFNQNDRLVTIIVAPSKESAEKLTKQRCVELTDDLDLSKYYVNDSSEASTEQVD